MFFRRSELVLEFALQRQQTIGIDQKAGSRVAEPEPGMASIEQLGAEFLFQRGDPAGNRRLRQAQLFRAAGDALEASDPDESFDKA